MAFVIPIVIFILLFWWFYRKPKSKHQATIPDNVKTLLENNVRYYQQLKEADKPRFVTEVNNFMLQVTIEGVGVDVDPLDKVLIAASAVIPIFSLPGWRYRNLTNVILYPDTFDEQFQYEGDRRNILGMVGSGPLNGQMLLSQSALRYGFSDHGGKSNTAIHEFVHLVDKTDGSVDGMPESLLRNSYSLPWLKVMHEEIKRIETGESDINPYAAMNQSEFLAVVAEYFFVKPETMQEHHPELYALLVQMFKQDPTGTTP